MTLWYLWLAPNGSLPWRLCSPLATETGKPISHHQAGLQCAPNYIIIATSQYHGRDILFRGIALLVHMISIYIDLPGIPMTSLLLMYLHCILITYLAMSPFTESPWLILWWVPSLNPHDLLCEESLHWILMTYLNGSFYCILMTYHVMSPFTASSWLILMHLFTASSWVMWWVPSLNPHNLSCDESLHWILMTYFDGSFHCILMTYLDASFHCILMTYHVTSPFTASSRLILMHLFTASSWLILWWVRSLHHDLSCDESLHCILKTYLDGSFHCILMTYLVMSPFTESSWLILMGLFTASSWLIMWRVPSLNPYDLSWQVFLLHPHDFLYTYVMSIFINKN